MENTSAQEQSHSPHPYSSLPQSKKRKKLPYTWLTFLFLIVLALIASVIVNIIPIKKDLRSATHHIQLHQSKNISPSGQ